MIYRNPVLPGFYPDPSICRAGHYYYLVTSTFHWFPGVPLFRSNDLLNWEQIGFCLNREEQLELRDAKPSGGVYAPTIRYYKNRFYMITTNVSGQGNLLVWADQPEGPWSVPVTIDLPGIDPSLYFEDDQVLVQTTGEGKGIIQAKLDSSTGKVSHTQMIWKGTGGRYPEAPHLYKVKNYYYLLIAEGGTEYGHMITMARSTSPWGPFEACPANPLLTHRNTEFHPIQGTGHADMIEDDQGHWWMVCLAFRPVNGYYHHLGRETFLVPMIWGDDGWPVVNQQALIEEEMESDALVGKQQSTGSWADYFDDQQLNFRWQFCRNPLPGQWSVNRTQRMLILQNDDWLSQPTVLATRQQHFKLTCQVTLYRPVSGDQGQAGLLVTMDDHHQVKLFFDNAVNQFRCVVELDSINHELGRIGVAIEKPVFILEADDVYYYFYIKSKEDRMFKLGRLECKYLSSEVAGGFTGVMIGMFCFHGQAAFAEFRYKAIEDYKRKGIMTIIE